MVRTFRWAKPQKVILRWWTNHYWICLGCLCAVLGNWIFVFLHKLGLDGKYFEALASHVVGSSLTFLGIFVLALARNIFEDTAVESSIINISVVKRIKKAMKKQGFDHLEESDERRFVLNEIRRVSPLQCAVINLPRGTSSSTNQLREHPDSSKLTWSTSESFRCILYIRNFYERYVIDAEGDLSRIGAKGDKVDVFRTEDFIVDQAIFDCDPDNVMFLGEMYIAKECNMDRKKKHKKLRFAINFELSKDNQWTPGVDRHYNLIEHGRANPAKKARSTDPDRNYDAFGVLVKDFFPFSLDGYRDLTNDTVLHRDKPEVIDGIVIHTSEEVGRGFYFLFLNNNEIGIWLRGNDTDIAPRRSVNAPLANLTEIDELE